MADIDDGFVTVEKKFKYMSLNKNKKKKNAKKAYVFQDPDEYTLSDLENVLTKRRTVLTESRFYKELLQLFHANLTPTKPHDMICYGLGSIQHSKNAQFQFELALLIRDLLKIPGEVSIYDPVMTELDKELCVAHKINVIEKNEEGKRPVDRKTLFYMPHCGRGLYSNTLSVNWSRKALENVILISNRFDMYVGSQLEKDLKRECPYLIPAVEVVECFPFPKEFDDNKVFNDMSIQTFPKERLGETSDTFWESIKDTDSPDVIDQDVA